MVEITRGRREKKTGDNNPARVFHDHAAEYDSWFADSPVYAIELAALRSLQSAAAGPRMEIGVGPGRFARALDVEFGLDPAWAPLRLAWERGIKCFQGVGEALPVKTGVVGTVYLLFTLCFGQKPQKIVEECVRILKVDGSLIIGMIPAGSSWGRDLAAKKAAGHKFYGQANFYTIATVCRWLARAGMAIIEYRSTLYQPPGRVARAELPRKALEEKAGFVVIVARKSHV